MAVPVQGRVTCPRDCEELLVRLTGAPTEGLGLRTHRQIAERLLENEALLRCSAETLRPGSAPGEGDAPPAAADLAATPFIQSDNARIAAAAKGIVAGATNSLDSALAVNRWVHARMRRNPQVSIPSAVEVLNRLEGDCNEHSYLAVALARAAGIPARVKVGIVYSEGKFYYHAWIAMYAGRWIEMDPTFGQDAVDATHIALLEGELKDQLKLVQVFGQLRAEILSERCAR